MKYKVYTKQINADAFVVEAKNKLRAKQLARIEWDNNCGFEVESIEEMSSRSSQD